MLTGKILIINNDEKLSNYLKEQLALKGFSVSLAFNLTKGLEDLRNTNFDLVITRFGMPDRGAEELIKEIKKIDPDSVIIAILEELSSGTLQDLLRLGVYEFLTKPLNLEKLFLIVRKGVELRNIMVSHRRFISSVEEHSKTLQKENVFFAKRIEELTKNLTRLYENLRTTYLRTIKALAQTIDARDHYTHSHSENVSRYAVRLAETMNLPTQDIEMIRQACELHDIGKIGISDKILSKETELTPEEREQIKLHSLKGAQILEPLNFLEDVILLVRQHHEDYDGSGYPDGHKEEGIPLGARIIRLADAYDAMTSARAYRKTPLTKDEAIAEIKRNSGRQFDPKVVEAFLKIVHEL